MKQLVFLVFAMAQTYVFANTHLAAGQKFCEITCDGIKPGGGVVLLQIDCLGDKSDPEKDQYTLRITENGALTQVDVRGKVSAQVNPVIEYQSLEGHHLKVPEWNKVIQLPDGDTAYHGRGIFVTQESQTTVTCHY